ncbi:MULTISPECIES: SDR family NAD(P)-dependent oxidoreductase [Streptomyces]|uniref:SDR family NAD(P)-dependent oxidoreductase n=1 Tax=Streptomyces TaxID=1883 RepID=UPI0004CC9050|nr:SDR family oxidoreductase [Streptomyces durhamensis]
MVTGAGHGIGLAIARSFLREGASVCAVDVSEENLTRQLGGTQGAELVCADLGGDPRRLAARLVAGNAIDVLVNNVGVRSGKSFLEIEPEDLRRTYATNIEGPWFLTRQWVRRWLDTGRRGSVVFVLSLHSDAIRMNPDYSTSKAALAMLVKELAVELGPHGVRVNAVAPGAIDTWSDGSERSRAHVERSSRAVPLGRLGAADDVAPWVLALSDERVAAYTTGSVITVDGGLGLHNWLLDLYADAADERDSTRFGPDDPASPPRPSAAPGQEWTGVDGRRP